jgi:hypothetical protein
LLQATQYDEVSFGYDAFELNTFPRVLLCHTIEVFDKCLFAVRDTWIVLNVDLTSIFFDGCSWLSSVEYRIVECCYDGFILLKIVYRYSSLREERFAVETSVLVQTLQLTSLLKLRSRELDDASQ